MARLILQYPADNLATPDLSATPSTEDSAYPIENLLNGNPAKPFKFDATSGDIVFDFGAPTQLDIFAIVMHNLDAGLNVRIQGNATNAWGGPTLDQAVVIPAYDKDGFPVNPWVDLTGIGSRTFQYWRLHIPVNSVKPALGHIHLGATKRSLVHNISWGFQEGVERTIVEHKTDYYVSTVYDLGVKVKTLQGEVETTDAGLTVIRDWWNACRGRALPTLIVADPSVNEALLVRWTE
jgi:hypothetical protein